MNVNRNNSKVFPPRTKLAIKLRSITNELFEEDIVTNVLDDPGFALLFEANSLGICTSYVRPTNDASATTKERIQAFPNVIIEHKFRAAFRSCDIPDTTRMCHAYDPFAAICCAFIVEGETSPILPSITEVILGHNRVPPPGVTTEDFEEKHGSIDIDPEMLYAREIVDDHLRHLDYILIDGHQTLKAFMTVIHDEGHIVFVLSDKELNILDEENNYLIGSTCGKNSFIPFIVKHVETGNITLVYYLLQMSSNVTGVSVC